MVKAVRPAENAFPIRQDKKLTKEIIDYLIGHESIPHTTRWKVMMQGILDDVIESIILEGFNYDEGGCEYFKFTRQLDQFGNPTIHLRTSSGYEMNWYDCASPRGSVRHHMYEKQGVDDIFYTINYRQVETCDEEDTDGN